MVAVGSDERHIASSPVFRRVVRLAVRVALLVALVWLARQFLKRWVEGPANPASSPDWPAIPSAPVVTPPRPAPAPSDASAGKVPDALRRAAPTSSAKAWVRPQADGSAPPTHPVKAKVSSRIYRVPGMASYDRSTADRCYPSAEAAEADGFSKAKR